MQLARRSEPDQPSDASHTDASATPIKRSSTVGSTVSATFAGAEDRWRAHSLERPDVHAARAAVLAQRKQQRDSTSAYSKVTRGMLRLLGAPPIDASKTSILTTASFYAAPVAGGRIESEPDLVLSSHTLARRESDV